MEKALPAPPARLDVVLYPNCSLGPAGFAVLMAAIALISAAVGAGFIMIGAWPVTGFFGLDLLLLYLAFRWNYRRARRAEFVRLDGDGLTVRRLEPDGRSQSWRFEPYWVRVSLEQVGRHDRRLVLRSHGRQVVIGAFLTLAERVELADALEAALRDHRAGAAAPA
ncbi:MAG TPA: DUF2244 domain-containing protein [Geminicoccaceae bacterium]|nr:DUF2244 domain-containing protein [Geminicoccaceae bacterium]